MQPTLPLANVAPPPARGGEPARSLRAGSSDAARNDTDGSGQACGEGGEFACQLQRARLPTRSSHESSTSKATQGAAGHASTRTAAARREMRADTRDADAQWPLAAADARGSAMPLDAAHEAVDGDTSTRPAHAAADSGEPPWPASGDALVPPCLAATVQHATAAAADAAADSGAGAAPAASDGDTAPTRTSRRAGHERRAIAQGSQDGAPPQAGPERAAAELPLRASPERTNADTMPAIAAHAPSFDAKAAPDAGAPLPWHAASMMRDPNASVVAGTASPHAQASVHAAIDDPAFGSALGHQVVLWVRDGVQEARLHLHPAELGPVAVQIALDGQAARVDFTAPVAATRDSIEQSLPALAAALRESGFTLTGGGVSSQAGQGGRSQPPSPAHETAGGDRRSAAEVTAPAGLPRRMRSLLDLYA